MSLEVALPTISSPINGYLIDIGLFHLFDNSLCDLLMFFDSSSFVFR